MKLTIWNTFIQNLVNSHEESSWRLAFALIDRPQNIFHWIYLTQTAPSTLKEVNLPLFIWSYQVRVYALFEKIDRRLYNMAASQHPNQELRKSYKKLTK